MFFPRSFIKILIIYGVIKKNVKLDICLGEFVIENIFSANAENKGYIK